ncbi:MAG: hypothetical protein DCF21_11795 [Leptolyngbya sp.]|nr:MAG: hypothetical protein DCF21_11795 [Leptolyngbya sp.]
MRSALARSARGLEPLETAAKALQPALVPTAIAPAAALGQGSTLPLANQVVKLESSWVSPEDPALVIQIWCTRTGAEPVCFTTTAARGG